jgi:outer membrane receptor protein involved in Fe transport
MDNGAPAPDEPRNSASLLAWTPLTERLGAGMSLYWQDASPRVAGDPRSDLPGYALLDLNLVYRLTDQVELGLAAYNLLDRDYAMPSPFGTIREDFRGAGRSLRAQVRVALR